MNTDEIREQIATDRTNKKHATEWFRVKLYQALDEIDKLNDERIKELERQIQKALDEIERLNKEIDQFYSSVPTANDIK